MLKKQKHPMVAPTPYHSAYWVGTEKTLLETHDHDEQETTGRKKLYTWFPVVH